MCVCVCVCVLRVCVCVCACVCVSVPVCRWVLSVVQVLDKTQQCSGASFNPLVPRVKKIQIRQLTSTDFC